MKYQKLSKEEFAQISLKDYITRRHGKANEFMEVLNTVEMGEAILISKSEWALKSEPAQVYAKVLKDVVKNPTGKKFSQRTLKDESGWVVVRIG